MTISIKHAFQTSKGDGTDATLVRPSAWNAAHTTSINTASLVGRLSAGVGAFEEIPITANGAVILAAADSSSFGFVTGDVKMSWNQAPPAGWIQFTGTIGSAASGATQRANADVLPLYSLIWSSTIDASFPVSGGRGASAAADFSANKTINLSGANGRTPINSHLFGAPGTLLGEASHVLTQAELPAVPLSVSVSGSAAVSTDVAIFTAGSLTNMIMDGANRGYSNVPVSAGQSGVASHGSCSATGGTSNMGSGAGHNNYQPSITLAFMVKL